MKKLLSNPLTCATSRAGLLTCSIVATALVIVCTSAFAGDGDNVGGYRYKIYGDEETGIEKPYGDLGGQLRSGSAAGDSKAIQISRESVVNDVSWRWITLAWLKHVVFGVRRL